MGDKQRLSTIVFGDIRGYTALMQDDEAHAMALLNIFKGVLEEFVPAYGGQIVQYFGDACLLSFESTSQAVRCTLKLQPLFREKQVPVRFGIHLGEVIFTEDNVFGDGVNVASRIESMGVAGGILVSKSVRDQVVNKPEFSLKSLGSFDFKNVEEPLEVYALANEGIVVPRREELQGKFKPPKRRTIRQELLLGVIALVVAVTGIWFLSPNESPLTEAQRNSYLAILPFENETNQASLDGFGTLVSDWLTTELLETGEVKILHAESLKDKAAEAGISSVDIPELFAENDIGMIITGRYYTQGDQLYVHTNIVETRTGLVVHAPSPIIRSGTQKSDILEALSEEILGYWEVRDLPGLRQNPPQYEAYREYLAGEDDFGRGYASGQITRGAEYFRMSEAHYLKAYQLDTTFLSPLLRLCVTYYHLGRHREQDSLYTVLEGRKNDMTKWELKSWEFEQARYEGENLEAARVAEEMFIMDPSDELAFSRACRWYLRANHPQDVMDFRQLADSIAIGELKKSLHPIAWRGYALYMLRRYDSAYTLYNEDMEVTNSWPNVNRHYTPVLIQTGRFEEIPDRILAAPGQGSYGKGDLLYSICNTLLQKNEKELAYRYARQLREFAGNHKDEPKYLQWMGAAEKFLENYGVAAGHLESYLENDMDERAMMDLIACYAHMGATEKIDKYISEYLQEFGDHPGIHYGRARAQSILGNHEQALESLATAIRQGLNFDDQNCAFDYHFRPLFDDPRFQRLVAPRG